jgi:hypothetical protein
MRQAMPVVKITQLSTADIVCCLSGPSPPLQPRLVEDSRLVTGASSVTLGY